jgi:hypothetical protein
MTACSRLSAKTTSGVEEMRRLASDENCRVQCAIIRADEPAVTVHNPAFPQELASSQFISCSATP